MSALAVSATQWAESSLGQPFHLGEVQTCKCLSIQPLVIISFISKSDTHVVPLKMGVKALRGAVDGSSSTNSCSQIFFSHYLLIKHITFPLGRWEGDGEPVCFTKPLEHSDSPASTFNPAGIKLLQLEVMLTAADKSFSSSGSWTWLLESLLTVTCKFGVAKCYSLPFPTLQSNSMTIKNGIKKIFG